MIRTILGEFYLCLGSLRRTSKKYFDKKFASEDLDHTDKKETKDKKEKVSKKEKDNKPVKKAKKDKKSKKDV